MSLTFNVSFTDMVGGYSSYAQLIQTDLAYAGSIWSSFFNSNASIEVQVNIEQTASDTANGTAATSVFLNTSNGVNYFRYGTIAEMLTGQDPNGAAPDAIINIDPDYLNQWLYFDPNPSPTSAVPANKVDAVELFEHELGHAFGFNGFSNVASGALNLTSLSTFDVFVTMVNGVPYFTGPKAEAVYGGPVPLTVGNFYHVGNSAGLPGSDLLGDLMNGVVGPVGKSPGPSALDLAILADAGVPMNQSSQSTVTLNDEAMWSAGLLNLVATASGFVNDGAMISWYGPVSAHGFTLTNLGFSFATSSGNEQFTSSNAQWATDFLENFDGTHVLHTIGNATTSDTQIRLQQQGGGPFTAKSVDLDSLASGQSYAVTFIGVTTSGATVTQTFQLDNHAGFQTFQFNSSFTNLVSLDLTTGHRAGVVGNVDDSVSFDNFVLVTNATAANQAPVLNAAGGSLSYVENHAAAAIDPVLTVSDTDSANLAGATVSISGNFVAGQDVLGFANQNGVTGSYNATTGVLTLSGSSSVANYQAALHAVTYANGSDNPSGATRTVSYQVDDGAASNHASNVVTATVAVTPVNDAPVITSDGGGDTATLARPENAQFVTTVTAADPDSASLTFSIAATAGTDFSNFTINPSTGTLAFGTAPDFETPADFDRNNSYVVQVRVSDGSLADMQTITVNVTDVPGQTILGTSGNDQLTGTSEADTINGFGGNDTLSGLDGNDLLIGGPGNDLLIGGPGTDTAVYTATASTYTLLSYNGTVAVLTHGADGADRLQGVENIQFVDKTVAASTAAAFDPLEYIASNGDLILAFGANPQAGFDHYIDSGFFEGRATNSFDALEYIASNGDLIQAFGLNLVAGRQHYITAGLNEHRATNSFDALEYIASNGDLIQAFGLNLVAGEQHYITAGLNEHRATNSFDAAQYLANYADLSAAFGNDLAAAERHYITAGFYEGRTDKAPVVTGDGGNNALVAANGAIMTGGAGADAFIFNFSLQKSATITDFAVGTDHLQISASGFGHGLAAGGAAPLVTAATASSATHAGTDGYFIFDSAGTVWWDSTGGSGADATALAKLAGIGALHASDFLLS